MRLVHRYMVLSILLFFLISIILFDYLRFLKKSKDSFTTLNLSNGYRSHVVTLTDTSPTNKKCRFHSCFNHFLCKLNSMHQIKVYIYPNNEYRTSNNEKIFMEESFEFNLIKEAIEKSQYFTENITEACLFIPPLDLLTEEGIDLKLASAILKFLSRWESGNNHVIFNLFPLHPTSINTAMSLAHGNAIVAGTNFISSNYRQGFDISIPLFTKAMTSTQKIPTFSGTRKWKLIVSQVSMDIEKRNVLNKLKDLHPDLLMIQACPGTFDMMYPEVLCKDSKPFYYPAVLQEGTFCLLLPGYYYGSSLLLDAMMMGCIPVIMMNDYVLPFSEVIDWSRAAVIVREQQIGDVMSILNNIKENLIILKRYQLQYLWQKYFNSIASVVNTTLDIINERIFIHQKKSYELLIIWNNPFLNPTGNWPNMLKPWKLIRSETNRLTNRFYPFPDIETEAVMAIDDDILMLTTDEIEFAYQTWCEFPDRLVGFPPRSSQELINGNEMKYKYESEWQNELSMVLTGAAFYHKIYNYKFTYELPLKAKEYIDQNMNCEDIAMNFLIASLTGKPPIKVTPRKRFKCTRCSANDSLWSETTHFVKRSECLKIFTQHFKRMPLQSVEFRVDPVLFQENISLSDKDFPDVGTV
ncbi:exostosin-2 isoform X3 [Hydra vulgaris]|uniref:Exostosin-2 isoform X3 n=1 Tax=Hydra vulgaris TaxID=6087 RepID=A0ABM4D806_HYDVU